MTYRVLIVGADVGAIAREGWELGGPYLWASDISHLGSLTRVDRVIWATRRDLLPAELVAAVERLVAP